MKKILFTSIFIINCIASIAQNQLSSYDLPSGFSFSQIRARNAFLVDASDNKWVGFNTIGLGKFDGSTWIVFDSLNSTLPVNRIISISSNTTSLWMGTSAGLSHYDGSTFTNFNSTNSPLPTGAVNSVTVNSNIIWAGTNQGLYKYDGSSWISYSTSNSGIVDDTIQCISSDPNGDVWIGTKNGLSFFANNNFTNYTTSNSNIRSNSILCITITNSNEVWLGTFNSDVFKFSNGNFIDLNSFVDRGFQNCNYDYSKSALSIGSDALNNVYILNGNNAGQRTLIKITPSNIIFSYLLQDTSNTFTAATNMLMQTNLSGILWMTQRFLPGPNPSRKIYEIDLNTLTGNVLLPADSNDLNINQVRARILNLGDMHWDPVSQVNHYEVPSCSNKNSVYASALWLGGFDASNNLHTAAMTYRQTSTGVGMAYDFFAGPLDTITGIADSANLAAYDRLWKVDRNIIDQFQQNFTNGNVTNGSYPVPASILTWPAQGSGNISRNLAPFVDYNTDGAYNPYDGDYPMINGDQMLWWVFNDTLAPHTETQGAAFGFEIHGKAYAFTCPTISSFDEAINYTTFYQYKIINRSPNTYHNMHIGLWCDADLGNAVDDYVGCDTLLNTGFVYNGDNDDETAAGYGLNPPMQNVSILKGPLADVGDGIDNNHNGTIDELGETIGISHFMYYMNLNNHPQGNPFVSNDYYDYLTGNWLDGLPVTYGGDGRNQNNQPTNFMFPGTPYDTSGWTMPIAGIPGADMRGLLSAGPFTIAPGEERIIDFAYVFTRDSTAPNGLTTSIAKNTADLIKVHQWFDNNTFPSCFNVGMNEIKNNESLKVFPNPANNTLRFKNVTASEKTGYTIIDVTGRVCSKGIYNGAIDISTLKSQLYIIQLNDGKKTSFAKFVKL